MSHGHLRELIIGPDMKIQFSPSQLSATQNLYFTLQKLMIQVTAALCMIYILNFLYSVSLWINITVTWLGFIIEDALQGEAFFLLHSRAIPSPSAYSLPHRLRRV